MNQKILPDAEMITYIEDERKRIARDIHDGPAQSLANVVFRMEFLEQLLKRGEILLAQEELQILKDLTKKALKEIKDFIFNIRPMSLDDLGLLPAVKKHIEKQEKEFGIKINLTVLGMEVEIKKETEIGIFRIIQEALNNIVKHSNAKNTDISVEFRENHIYVSITDDGYGFNLHEVFKDKRKSMGIVGMRERAEILGGTFSINSEIGKGTQITVKIPLK